MNTLQKVPSPSIRRRQVLVNLCGITAVALAACSKPEDAPSAPAKAPTVAMTPEQFYGALAKEGKGFTVGAMMAANPVYVMFDPQCPHCGHLWQQSMPLQKKAKFVWIPVAFINAKSKAQGAALLGAANPLEAMTVHEASILAGTGGTPATGDIAPDIAAAIQKNTDLLNNMGVESVPYIVARNSGTSQVVTHTGALDSAALAQFLGLN